MSVPGQEALLSAYERDAADEEEDISRLKIIEVNNWLPAWMFMEMCGFVCGGDEGDGWSLKPVVL